jgi:thymidylate synthase
MNVQATNVPEAFATLNQLLGNQKVQSNGWLECINTNIEIQCPWQRVATVRNDPIAFVPYMALQWAWYSWGVQNTELKKYYPQAWERAQKGDVNSNYGQYVWDEGQFQHCFKLLRQDPDSRRAMIMFNRREVAMSGTNDHICTTSLQFLLRERKLNLITTMRSNELNFGFRTDAVFFTMLQEIMAALLGVDMGIYCHNAGSLHVKPDQVTDKHVTHIEQPRFNPLELSDMLGLVNFFDEDYSFETSPFELTAHLQHDLRFFKS